MSTTTTVNDFTHPLSKALPKTPIGPMRAPARALGWFSIGLGLAELAMPRKLARAAGMPNVPALTRFYGLREIGTGIHLFAQHVDLFGQERGDLGIGVGDELQHDAIDLCRSTVVVVEAGEVSH